MHPLLFLISSGKDQRFAPNFNSGIFVVPIQQYNGSTI